jgi:hypothetical protein
MVSVRDGNIIRLIDTPAGAGPDTVLPLEADRAACPGRLPAVARHAHTQKERLE